MGMFAAKLGGFTAGLALLSLASIAHAQTAPATVTLPPAGDTLVTTLTSAYSGSTGSALGGNLQTVSGNFYTAVYRNTTTNFLDFLYQVSVSSTTSSVTGIQVSDFTGYTTTLGQSTAYGIAPFTSGATNQTATDGNVFSGSAQFAFVGANAILAGEQSATLLVKTNATSYSSNNAAILGAVATNANDLSATVASPEPGALALAIPGLFGVIGMISRRKRA